MRVRGSFITIAVLASLLLPADPASAAAGDLTPLPDPHDCITTNNETGCAPEGVGGNVLGALRAVAMAPDGRSVYTVGDTLYNFDRSVDATAPYGRLVVNTGSSRCHHETAALGCADANGISAASEVVVSGDGKNVYTAASSAHTITVFDRDTTGTSAHGDLSQKPTIAGCIKETGDGVTCGDAVALEGPQGIAIAPDGKTVYVATSGSHGLAIFDRATNGVLTQKSGAAACVMQTGVPGSCTPGRGLAVATDVAVSADNRNVYVISGNNGVSVWDRDISGGSTHGELTQKAGTAGCILGNQNDLTCTSDAPGLSGATDVAITRDGTSLYVAGAGGNVAIFDRATDGTLTQKAAPNGCIAESGDGVTCVDGRALVDPFDVTVAPDGATVYVSAQGSDSIAVLDRSPTGALSQSADIDGCVSLTGAGACTQVNGIDQIPSAALSPGGYTLHPISPNTQTVGALSRERPGGPHQPDGLIRAGSSGAFLGGDTYNTTGAGQTVVQKRKRGKSASYGLRIENDGDVPQTFAIGPCPAARGFTTQYLDGSTDITAAVVGGSRTVTLAPFETRDLTVRIKSKRTGPRSRVCGVPITSQTDGTAQDTPVAVLKVKS